MENKYHITQRPDGKWQGKQEGADRASVVEEKKSDAQQATIDIAKNKGNASVYIHGRDGKFKEERTYPRSQDPPGSRG